MNLPKGHEVMTPIELALSVALQVLKRRDAFMEECERLPCNKNPPPIWVIFREETHNSIKLIEETLEVVREKNRQNFSLNATGRERVMQILLKGLEHISCEVKTKDEMLKLIGIARAFVEVLS